MSLVPGRRRSGARRIVGRGCRTRGWEETGLDHLPEGVLVWTRDVTYTYAGRSVDVHEDWLHVQLAHFNPVPAQLTDFESTSIQGFGWWTAKELQDTEESIYPPDLGWHLIALQADGYPAEPIDIGTR